MNLKTQGTLLIRITNASRRYRYAAEESSRLKQETTPATPALEQAPGEADGAPICSKGVEVQSFR